MNLPPQFDHRYTTMIATREGVYIRVQPCAGGFLVGSHTHRAQVYSSGEVRSVVFELAQECGGATDWYIYDSEARRVVDRMLA